MIFPHPSNQIAFFSIFIYPWQDLNTQNKQKKNNPK